MTTERKINVDYTTEKSTELKSMWINGPVNCLGRFTPTGFEIFREMKEGEEMPENMAGNVLVVQMKNTNLVHWNNFRTLMKEHHNIDIPEGDFPGEI